MHRMSDMFAICLLEKVGSTLYEMVSSNVEKFHLEDRRF